MLLMILRYIILSEEISVGKTNSYLYANSGLISMRFSRKLRYYGEEKYVKTVPVHIFTVSPTLGIKK